MDSILFVCLAVVDCWLLCFSTNCTLYSKVFCLIITRVMLKVCGSSLSTRVTTRSCSESSPMGGSGSTWATTTTRVVLTVSALTGRCYYTCVGISGDDTAWLLIGGNWWLLPSAAIDGRCSLDGCLRLAIPWKCIREVSAHGGGIFTWKWKGCISLILSPLVRIKKLLISDIAGDGSAKASVVDFFVGWHGIGGDRFGGFDVLWCFCVFGLLFGRALWEGESRGDIWVIEKRQYK